VILDNGQIFDVKGIGFEGQVPEIKERYKIISKV